MNKTEEELIWESYLENKYVIDIEDIEYLQLNEGVLSDAKDILKVIGNTILVTPAWFMEILKYIKNVSIAGVSGIIIAKGIATLLSFVINKYTKKYNKKQDDKNMIKHILLQRGVDKIEDLTIEDVESMREEISHKIDKMYPDTKSDQIAIVLKKVQDILNSTFGLAGAGLGMGILYSKLGGLPDYDEVYDRVTNEK